MTVHRAPRPWSDKERETLKAEWETNESGQSIARRHGRSYEAVAVMANKMGLPQKPVHVSTERARAIQLAVNAARPDAVPNQDDRYQNLLRVAGGFPVLDLNTGAWMWRAEWAK